MLQRVAGSTPLEHERSAAPEAGVVPGVVVHGVVTHPLAPSFGQVLLLSFPVGVC